MEKTRKEKRGGQPEGRGGVDGGVEIDVQRLGQRFAMFRRSHESGARIPDALRAGALAALGRGASEGDVRRACQVTSVQLRQWRKQLRRGVQVGAAYEPGARVFQVVDEPGAPDVALGCNTRAPELELRIGGWAVRISPLAG